jgi:hypothetical protein
MDHRRERNAACQAVALSARVTIGRHGIGSYGRPSLEWSGGLGGQGSTRAAFAVEARTDRLPRRGHRLPGHAADRGQVPDETTVSDLPDNESCGIVAEVGQGDTDLRSGEMVIALLRYSGYAEQAEVPQGSHRVPTDTRSTTTPALAWTTAPQPRARRSSRTEAWPDRPGARRRRRRGARRRSLAATQRATVIAARKPKVPVPI